MAMWRLVVSIVWWGTISVSHSDSSYDNRAKFLSENGHLYIIGAESGNITLKTTGMGFVNINDENLVEVSRMARTASFKVERFQSVVWREIESSFRSLQKSVNDPGGLKNRIELLEGSTNLTTSRETNEFLRKKVRRLNRRVTEVERRIQNLQLLLLINECESNPCQNGGSCIDMFDGFLCRCPDEWEGPTCSVDVNECAHFAGSTLGCQNGATCINNPGSYICKCSNGWYGLHCTQRTYDCSRESSRELCGHGICIAQGGTGRGFACICDPGWAVDPSSGSCIVDKDECREMAIPCSHDPPVDCINTPGSFRCGSCPHGYTGNGYQCRDVDECLIENGGCSMIPRVQCINIRGSRACGMCPPGYIGNGITCTFSGGLCSVNNGGCHPQAVCSQNPGLNYVQCLCPAGWIGSGIGENGCQPVDISSNPCGTNPCKNGGTCAHSEKSFKCHCRPGFSGPTCNLSPCNPNPCLNGGKCREVKVTGSTTFMCSCTTEYFGALCESKSVSPMLDGCVDHYEDLEGVLRWPLLNSTDIRPGKKECEWKIKSSNNSLVIKMKFIDIQINDPDSTCTSNYIEIYDGATVKEESNKIGRYCNDKKPTEITSSQSSVQIVYFTSSNAGSFFLNWTTVEPSCGDVINASSHGTVSYPKYGSKGILNKECYWKFIAPIGRRIQFTFFSLLLKAHVNCTDEFLEVRDGEANTSPILAKFCNKTTPAPLVTSNHIATLHSVTTGSDGNEFSFQVAYAPIEGMPGCGGVLTGPTGEIISPAGPDRGTYNENLNCEWKIQLPLNERIRITFETFSIESSIACKYDFLKVFDGSTTESDLVGMWCGSTIPTPFTSTSNVLTVFFHSDFTYNDGGFRISYITVCGGTFSDPEGTIHSPYYPSPYPHDRVCEYTIVQPLHSVIKLTFLDFDMEEKIETNCTYDYVKIFDGHNDEAREIGEYCGSSSPPQILSSFNYLHIVFKTDENNHGRGFRANYSSIDLGCGGILTEKSGFVTSPKYPEHYPPSKECKWVIHVPKENLIQLTWLAFNVEYSTGCGHDWIEMYDSSISMGNKMGLRYCGSTLPPTLTSTSNIVIIVFHTDRSTSEPGFRANYMATPKAENCGGNFYSTMGTISSPKYPDNYANNLDCTWVINVPHGQQIQLTVESFNLEPQSRCIGDILEIRNGGYATSPLIKKYCNSIDKEIISMTNQLYLRFTSDSSITMSGFLIRWNGALRGCGGLLTSASGAIISPNYPQPYGKNGECYWRISVSMGNTIQLTIVDLDLEEHSTCYLDYIEFFDGVDKRSPSLGRYCSSANPLVLNSKTNHMFIRFRSDMSKHGRGFHLKYNTVCNLTLTGFRGVIESPNFPQPESFIKECIWKISAPAGNSINITFSHFNIAEPPIIYAFFPSRQTNCTEVFLEITEGTGSGTPSNQLGKFCGSSIPPKVSSSLNNVYVRSKSNNFILNNIFRLEWIVSGCGGIFLDKPSGEFKSPGYPKPYNHSLTCEWYIAVQSGKSIQININFLEMEVTDDCYADYLSIYGGPDDSAPLLAKLCSTISEPSVQTTSGNFAFIRFKSDDSSHAKGFIASFITVDSQCGGTFIAESGSIHSHNYPQNYDSHDDCMYFIRVDKNQRVNLTFVDFDIASSLNCSMSYVKVYDGNSIQSPLLMTQCDNKLPPSVISSNNELLVRLKSDGYYPAKGFLASYKPLCGANIVTSGRGTINYQEGIQYNLNDSNNCSWIIRASELNVKISLHFVVLSIGADKSDTNSIEIYAGSDPTSPLITSISGHIAPPAIVTSSSVVLIVYTPSSNAIFGQFVLDYSVLDSVCGGDLSSENGIFTSPNFPDSYPKNAECVWNIKASPGNDVMFGFLQLSLPESQLCNEDYVEIRERYSGGKLLGVYCGTTLPQNITVAEQLWVKFRSSGDEQSAVGFSAAYNLAHDHEISGVKGSVASPLFPFKYKSSGQFTWRITVRLRKEIKVTFIDIYSENIFDEVCESGVKIYDGYDTSAKTLVDGCTMAVPEPITSTSNVIYIVFSSYLGVFGSSFLLDWEEVSKVIPVTTVEKDNSCMTRVELSGVRGKNKTYVFSSPGFPNGYGHNLHCTWIIETVPQNHLMIIFNVIDLEKSWECHADYISIYGVVPGSKNEWDKKYTLCHSNGTLEHYKVGNMAKIMFDTDFYDNRTGFTATVDSVCGGSLTGPVGVLTNKGWGIMICKWDITVRLGHTINITFTNFNMEIPSGDVSCKRNYVVLRNGGSEMSPFLGVGKYCGTTAPVVPLSTSNKLYVEVVVETSQQIMELVYKEVSVDCGDDITLTKRNNWIVINSPNYPNIPPPHIECIWRIMAPAGESIHFEITERFDMTSNRGCTKEYLELRDGGTDSSHLIGRYCTVPSFKVTKGNVLYVKYFTDVKDPKDGFRANVSVSKCGGTIYDSRRGTIESPGYPGSYDSDMSCEWRLVANERYIYKLRFKQMNLGPRRSISCENAIDTVTIKDVDPGRPFDNGSYSQTFCGKNSSATFKTIGNIAVINFKSGKQPEYAFKRSFSIEYNASFSGCGSTLNLPSAQIMSPGYPTYSKGNSYCMWKITAPYDRKVTFTVEDFDLSLSSTNLITWGAQRLDFYNGFKFSNLLDSWQGQKPAGTTIESSGSKMMILYRTKYPNNHRGFKGKYTTDKPADCGGTLMGRNGSIQLMNKNVSFYCEWAYEKPSEANGITFLIEIVGSVSPLTEAECASRWLLQAQIKVVAGSSNLGGFCSKSTPQSPYRIISPYHNTVIQAHNIVDLEKDGNRNTVNVTIAWRVNDCGGLRTSANSISSPDFPQSYPPNVDCVWLLKLPQAGERINVHFDVFNLENDCNNDYLSIRNGDWPTSPEIGRYCGSIIPADIISQQESLWITFHANDKTQASGFKITLTTVSQGCGGIIHDSKGVLQTPDYPVPYKNNIECDWEIRVDPGLHIGLTFKGRFYLEDSPNCQNDFIEVSDFSRGAWKPLGRVCGRPFTTPMFNTTSNRMRVLFRSNDKITADGFKAEWSTNCGSVIEANGPGKLHSPGFPKNYEGPLNCNYTVTAPGKILTARFNTFKLEGGRAVGCAYDKVVIYTNKESGRYSKFGTYCGPFLPPSFTSKEMFGLHFIADTWASNTGFELEYDVEACGGTITSETSISPPKFNGKYFPNMYCEWNITAPNDKIIIIKFSKFYVSSSLNCLRDYVMLLETNDKPPNSTKLLGRVCGNYGNSPPVFRTSGNTGRIVFSTDQFHNTEGFTAIISFKQACGGHKDVGSALTLVSPDIDQNGNYEPLMDCHWILTAPPQTTIVLTFKRFDMHNCFNATSNQACNCDYIEIFDGPSENDELIGRYCKGKEPRTMSSSSRYLSIKFISDEIFESGGFEIQAVTVRSQCGPSILNATEEPQELTSPGYPNNYPNNVHCIWLLILQSFGDIDIHFKNFDLEPSESCSADRLEIKPINFYQRPNSYISEGTGKDKIFIGRTNHFFLSNPSVHIGSRMPVTKSTFCGQGKPIDYYSNFRQVRLRFTSNEQISGKGFRLSYNIAKCSRNFTSEQGRILKSRLNGNCYLTVIAPDPNATVSIYFSDLSTLDRDQCSSTKLQVFDGLTDSSPILTTACGHSPPSPVFSTGRNVLIKFTTFGSSYLGSFDITYTTTTKGRGCGGTIFNYGGVFSSPFYPGNYRNNTICRWDISVPVDNVIVIQFMEFDLGTNTCESDYVELLDVNPSTGIETQRSIFCGTTKPAKIEGRFGALAVKYKTSVHNSGIGWLARFMSKVAPENNFP